MTPREIIAGLVGHIIQTDQREGLASYIEAGGDLSDIGDHEREILARLVRGESPRKRGQKQNSNESRDWSICADVAWLQGLGQPVYPGRNEDACEMVASRYHLSARQVLRIWESRDRDNPYWEHQKQMGRKHAVMK